MSGGELVVRLLLAAEVVFVAVMLAGVAMLSVPVALILGGVLGVVATERASALARARELDRGDRA